MHLSSSIVCSRESGSVDRVARYTNLKKSYKRYKIKDHNFKSNYLKKKTSMGYGGEFELRKTI